MVYRGKPSAACAECRKLRSRCDKKVPACGQCVKTGRFCSGYRNVTDLMFHDESMQVFSKNKNRSPLPKDNHGGIDLAKPATAQYTPTSPFQLTNLVMYQPLGDLGVNFFMSNFIGGDPDTSLLYYLPSFYAKTGSSNPALHECITAVGLVGYANASRRKDMINIAANTYGAAIRSINAALTDPQNAAQDSILTSIYLAAVFEAIVIPRKAGMDNCCKHLSGAVAVASLILKQDKPSDVTSSLLTSLVKAVILNCWIQHVPLPPNFVQVKQLVEKKTNLYTEYDAFLDILMELVRFREELRDGTYHDSMAIIREALAIDARLDEFSQDMPRRSWFTHVQLTDIGADSWVYKGYYHVYPQQLAAHLWNNVRSSRIRMHQVVLRQCEVLVTLQTTNTTFLNNQPPKSNSMIISLATEIAATVPQLAGYEQGPATQPSPTRTEITSQDWSSMLIHTPKIPISPETVDGTMLAMPMCQSSKASSLHTPPLTPSPSCSPCSPNLNNQAPIHPFPENTEGQRTHSFYHMLYQLYTLRSISCLPGPMKAWIDGRIACMESNMDPLDLVGLQDTIRQRPGDGFPVSEVPEYVMYKLDPEPPSTNWGLLLTIRRFAKCPTGAAGAGSRGLRGRGVWISVYTWFAVGWEQFSSQEGCDGWWRE